MLTLFKRRKEYTCVFEYNLRRLILLPARKELKKNIYNFSDFTQKN